LTRAAWRGQSGTVLLGPTEDRVARYLDDATRHGRVTLGSRAIADRLGLGRSELYRVTAQLRALGLFGIENDQGGRLGGRRYWRTGVRREGRELDAIRHRLAWARITGWIRGRRGALLARIRALHTAAGDRLTPPRPMVVALASGPAPVVTAGAGPPTFGDRFAAAWRATIGDSPYPWEGRR
jgi:hypothetical protein